MGSKALATLCCATVAIAVVPLSASGHTRKIETELVQRGGGTSSDGTTSDVSSSGLIESSASRCVTARRVRFIALLDDPLLLDVDTSSRNGAWAVTGSHPGPVASYRFKAPRKVLVKRAGHRHFCGAAFLDWTPPVFP